MMKRLLPILAVLLAVGPGTCWAKIVPAESPIVVNLKAGEVTRVVMPSVVSQVLPTSTELDMKIDGQNLFIKPLAPGVDKGIFVTAGHKIYKVRVHEASPPDDVVQIEGSANLEKSAGVPLLERPPAREAAEPPHAVESGRGEPVAPGNATPTPCILRALAGGPPCPQAHFTPLNQVEVYKDGMLEVLADGMLSLGHVRGIRARVINLRKFHIGINAKNFVFSGALAVAVDREILAPGKDGAANLYFVLDDRIR